MRKKARANKGDDCYSFKSMVRLNGPLIEVLADHEPRVSTFNSRNKISWSSTEQIVWTHILGNKSLRFLTPKEAQTWWLQWWKENKGKYK